MIEVEVKVRADHEQIRPILKKIGAVKIKTEVQSDTYFAAPHRDFAKTDEALRIRSLDDHSVLTYKGPKLDKVSKTREEFEIPIEEATFTKILHALGFTEAGTVRKSREVFEAGEITISFDSVESLGEFLEVEIMAESEEELETARQKLFELLKQFGFGEKNSIRVSYLEMVLEKNKG
jgi:adenylate cyclase, class 2